MDAKDVLNYLEYAQSVLGIEKILVSDHRPRFVIEAGPGLDSVLGDNPAAQMFTKMLNAVGLAREIVEIKVIDSAQLESDFSQSRPTIYMLSQSLQQKFSLVPTPHIFSFHPAVLIQRVELKKQAWEHLKLFQGLIA